MTKMAAVCLGMILLLSCQGGSTGRVVNVAGILRGYWIPKTIKWGGDDFKSRDTGDIFRTASFKTLVFDSSGTFIYFASTQRHPKDYDDSLIFEGEPGVEIFKGIWTWQDTLMKVSYKVVYTRFTPMDTTVKAADVKLVFGRDTSLFFDGEEYSRTLKYDKLSLERIRGYERMAGH